MSAQLMDLVRELKALNARKKRGEPLSEAEEKRRKELKAYLKEQMAKAQSSGELATQEGAAIGSAIASIPSSPPPAQERTQGTAAPAFISMASADAPASARKPYTPKKNAFAIDAGDLLEKAAQSKAVEASATSPSWTPSGGGSSFEPKHASRADIEEMEARAERAARAHQTRPRPATPEEVLAQLEEIKQESGYTPPEENFYLEQYYGEYYEEGYETAEEVADLAPIDPREIELYRAGLAGSTENGEATIAIPPGLAFLDDFSQLYLKGILPPPEEEEEADSDDPNLIIPGKRKVTVHLLNGQVKRGAIRQMRRGDLGFCLEPQGAGRVEELSVSQVKAIFVHFGAKKDKAPASAGRRLTVTFKDRRSVQGTSDDYQPGAPVFSLIPPPGRGQFERIIVNSAAVSQVR